MIRDYNFTSDEVRLLIGKFERKLDHLINRIDVLEAKFDAHNTSIQGLASSLDDAHKKRRVLR